MTTCIQKCRSCNSTNIEVVFDLGEQVLTGVFQKEALDDISSGPVALVACNECRLVQMQYSYPLDEMYNDGYGYQSGLTLFMSQHLKGVLSFASDQITLKKGDHVLDIGCNDGYFSKLFLEAGASVIALDSDPVVVDRLWRKVRNQNLDIIPLVQNITSPSPGSGWRNGEKQSFLDRICGLPHTAILLAVVHHMMVTDGIPLDEIIDLVAEIVSAEVIIEFIPIDDPMFRKICRGRENLYSWYDQKSFEISCLRRFEIIETCLFLALRKF